jgi:hypothetical protein
MSGTAGSRAMRVVIAGAAVWTVVCVAAMAWQAVRNPMQARKAALDERLSSVVPVTGDDIPQPDQAPLRLQRTAITDKKALWTELIAAPTAAPKPEVNPDLKSNLKGITATRQQISSKDGISVKMLMNPQDKRGSWKAIGDTINGLTIRDVTPEAVIFSIKQNGKEYTVELPRS